MEKGLQNLFMFLAICFVAYIMFSNLNFDFKFKEGMTTSTSSSSSSSSTNGIAGNAATYGV